MELTANCHRSQGWWAITVPEIAGLFTQTRRLDQVEAMVKDAASLLLERPEEDFTVTVVPQFEDQTLATVTSAKQARERLRASQAEAAETTKEAAAILSAEGLTVRDIGTVLGVSHQRAARLAA